MSLALPFSAAHAEDKPKVALVMKSLANEFFRTMEDGAKDYQKTHSDEFDLIANGIKNETDTGASGCHCHAASSCTVSSSGSSSS